jgi:hypothetical protein
MCVCGRFCLSMVAIGDTGLYYIWRDKGCPMADKEPRIVCRWLQDEFMMLRA